VTVKAGNVVGTDGTPPHLNCNDVSAVTDTLFLLTPYCCWRPWLVVPGVPSAGNTPAAASLSMMFLLALLLLLTLLLPIILLWRDVNTLRARLLLCISG
jgi:hypothetical protein